MRWRTAHLLVLVLIAAIALAIGRSLWGPVHHNARVVFGAHLVPLVAASIASCRSRPRWRRLWLGYAAFGWAWLALVLRHYLGRIPDAYAENLIAYTLLGTALSLVCALVSHALPGMREA